MEKPYKTILEPAEDEFVEKKSRFIAYTSPVHTVEEANAFIAGIRQRHWDATHNVPAFVLRSGVQRSSDDGEPGGTAGMPVLDVLLKSGVQDVCVVVTRYFGGILLGAGGLVRAYSHACSLALEAAGVVTMASTFDNYPVRVVTMAPCAAMELTVDYSYYERVNNLLADHGARVQNADFGAAVTLTYTMEETRLPAFAAALTELSGGKYAPTQTGSLFAPV